jgi:hypothetical protein
MRPLGPLRPLGTLRALGPFRPLGRRPGPRDLRVLRERRRHIHHRHASGHEKRRNDSQLPHDSFPFLSVSSRRLATPRGEPRCNDAQAAAESPAWLDAGVLVW